MGDALIGVRPIGALLGVFIGVFIIFAKFCLN
jgi:hypothetical protein